MLLVSGMIVDGERDADLFFAGTAAAIVGVPLALPATLRFVGGLLGRLSQPAVSLSGRSMQRDPARSTRPFAGVAALVVLAAAAAGYWELITHTEEPTGLGSGPQAVFVEWRGGDRGLTTELARAVPDLLVAPFKGQDAAAEELLLGATCEQLQAQGLDVTCPAGVVQGPDAAPCS